MDVVGYRDNLRVSAGKMRWWRSSGQVEVEEKEELVEVLLEGRAPWGFSLRGGLEHREPLVITKVEEGSQAAAVCLQAGDEMVSVNAVRLCGSRQEAISLVKSSHKTLALVVRRKNEPVLRPHSWYSSKLTEEETEPTRSDISPADVWQPNHEARSKELSSERDQSNLHQPSIQFTSVNNMEKLERPSHINPPDRLSPTKYTGKPEALCGGVGKRDSGFSCFSSGSSPPVPATGAENIFFRGLQSDRSRYLQPMFGAGGWETPRVEEQPDSRVSGAGRPSGAPLWQVPERKKTQSPPPPPPPLRSDSFAATKVFPSSDGPSGQTKSQGRGTERSNEASNRQAFKYNLTVPLRDKSLEAKHSFVPLPTKDFLHPNMAADPNHNQLHPNKLFSLSSIDVRQTQSHFTHLPNHQRQYSDESPFYLQTLSAPPTKPQSVGCYYRSLQDLPTNASSRNQLRNSAVISQGSAVNPNQDNGGLSRYYGTGTKLSVQSAEQQARPGRAEGQRGDTETPHWANSHNRSSLSSLKTNCKTKYSSLPQSPLPCVTSKEDNGHSQQGNSLPYELPVSEMFAPVKSISSSEETQKRVEGHPNNIKRYSPSQHSDENKVFLPRYQDVWVPQEDNRISPFKTPLLHSLTLENQTLAERRPTTNHGTSSPSIQDLGDPAASSGGKVSRRGERYATTLRNEIQQKRAQLQKSRSAASLICGREEEENEEEEDEGWKSTETSTSSNGSFSNTYKDHLKEAQARVLQATSFQRRDLDPLGGETLAGKSNSSSSSQRSRIRGRKRIALAKRTHSFSEPDKMDKVGLEGVEEEPETGSFGERRKFFEAKPTSSRPLPKSGSLNSGSDLNETAKAVERVLPNEPQQTHPGSGSTTLSQGQNPILLSPKRLGTFAEYQVKWSSRRKASETRTQGRYHSAENILDAEEKTVCIHERSRSSPSAEFYTQSFPETWSENNLLPETRNGQHNRETTESSRRYQSSKSDQRPQPSLHHRTKPDATAPHASQSSHSSHASLRPPSPASQTRGLLPAPRPHLGPQTTSSSQEFFRGVHAEAAAAASPRPLSGAAPCLHPNNAVQSHGSYAGSASAISPAPRQEGAVRGEEREQPPPSSSSSSSSSSYHFSSKTVTLSFPAADRPHSPSPLFAPQRLTNAPPPASVQDDSLVRSEIGPIGAMDQSGPARKVPVKIVHAESRSERDTRAYPACNGEAPEFHGPRTPSLFSSCKPQETEWTRPQVKTQNLGDSPSSTLLGAANITNNPPFTSGGDLHSEAEDAKREELARDIVDRDKSLADILDRRGMRTTMDLMEGLFPQGQQILEGGHQRRRAPNGPRPPAPRNTDERGEEEGVSTATSLVPSSSYYNTSAPKAELLIKLKGMQEQLEEQDSEDELDVDLAGKKELISSLARKLGVLREARQSLQEDVEDNEALGRAVEATVQRVCLPNQLDKFRMFVGDLDKVVSLLLSLSGRLARVENALNSLEDEAPPEEKRTLKEKRTLLMRQHEDAKELKENLDRREQLVSAVMEVHLDLESLDDYRHFVKMKSALIIEQRKLEDKIKLGEEQLKCLVDSLPLDQRPPL
ncbi:protein Shroom2-like isoform X2 [Lampris incognitus]|uniref:protein Shroom2-like isoform X2 n=1 Tax=Lampris incognitus TaxID=2546036 RepID=UPI0024B5D1C3|nr:protein Shroom2-like isoform X2 [Lampris incognitus]